MKKILAFTLFLFFIGNLIAQDPVYEVLGEQELSNTDIYGIYQDQKEQLFVGTNNGLFIYKNGTFQAIRNAKEQIGYSVFQIQEDNNGNIYCCNLSGQIFQVNTDTMRLFYQCDKSILGNQFYFFFDTNNRLIVISKQVLSIQNGVESILYQPPASEIYHIQPLAKDTYALYSENPQQLVYYKGNSISIEPIQDPLMLHLTKTTGVFQIGQLQDLKLYKTLQNEIICAPQHSTKLFQNVGHERYYQLNNNLLLALSPKQGMRTIYLANNILQSSTLQLGNYFISTFAQGQKGTLFLGTFGNGILMIPKLNLHQIPLISGMRSLTQDSNQLYLTNRNGTLYQLDDKRLIPIDSIPARSLDKIYCSHLPAPKNIPRHINQHLIYDGGISSKFGVIKDVFTDQNHFAFWATSRDIYYFPKDTTQRLPYLQTAYLDNQYYQYLGKKQRYNAVAFDTSDQSLYVVSNRAVTQWSKDSTEQELLYQGNSIVASDALIKGGLLYLATNNKGILVFRQQQFVKVYDVSFGYKPNTITKFLEYQQWIFILSPNGLYILDTQLQSLKLLGFADGLVNTAILDMAISNNELKLLYKDALVTLPIQSIQFDSPKLNFQIDAMLVNNAKVDWQQPKVYNYMQNRIAFQLHFPSIEYAHDAYYYYKIKELEADWQRISVQNSLIEYLALPHGNYTFQIKVKYHQYESPVQAVTFVIYPPFWQRWWFYLALVLGIGSISAIFYRVRIRQIHKLNEAQLKNQQVQRALADSQLKALRSQMNPHFIFNSLNAIQDLILQQDTDNSYDYIVLFADLVRNTLNHSNQDFIPIDKEIEFLEIYLSLEKLRFKETLDYTIVNHCHQELEVPSLLIQPFIENALLHGLLHQQGNKKLTVEFVLEANQLTCTICDNGVGRKKSGEINKRKGDKHTSFSLAAMETRMRILAEQQGMNVGYEIIDLYENDLALGTKVIIRLPYKMSY